MTEVERGQIYRDAIDKWEVTSQAFMVMEEVGEMLDKFGKAHRGRLKDKMELITELADVTIMIEQWAAYFGWDEFVAEKEYKLERLRDRLNKKEGNE
jgi:NTP pyrophosphatase (non-canonical NTP hydrolase)